MVLAAYAPRWKERSQENGVPTVAGLQERLFVKKVGIYLFLYCIAGIFCKEFNFIAFVKAIFDKIKFLTNFFTKIQVLD